MESLLKIYNICEELNKQGISSYDQLKFLKDTNELDNILNLNNIPELLKKDFKGFCDVLFSNIYPHYLKSISLYTMLYYFNIGATEYVLSLYCDNEAAYSNFPLLLKSLIEKLDISEYAYLDVNDIKGYLYGLFNINDEYNPNKGKHVFQLVPKFHNSIYNQYSEVWTTNQAYVKVDDRDWFYIWGEFNAYTNEKNSLTDYKYQPLWVSKDYGDGYGFDVLSFDTKDDKEKLIEVKTGKRPDFSLTENEHKVMRNSHLNNAIYSIQKYTYDKATNQIVPQYYVYSPEIERLVNGNGEIFNFTRYRNDEQKVMYGVNLDLEFKSKIKTLTNS